MDYARFGVFDSHGKDGVMWIGFDLDGTLAEKVGAWKGIEHIGKPIMPLIVKVKEAHANGKKVKIFTARVADKDDAEEAKKFDFLVGGYHYGVMNCHAVDNWLLARKHYQEGGNNGLALETSEAYEKQRMINTEMYIKTLRENDLRILTHPGDKGPVDIREVAKVCAETDTWMEINTWHMHLTTEEISIAMQEDVKFVISSDAHTPNRVGSYLKGLERAFQAGLDPERIVNIKRK